MQQSDIYDVFDEGGALSKRFKGYEYREGQLEMALTVAEVYRKGGIAVMEAGTGIGKSFAYLVCALLHANEDPDDKTIVATATINLQKQLFDKDLVQLFEVLETSCSVAMVMGRGNYLCLRRLEDYVASMPLLARDASSGLSQLINWSERTETGLRIDIPFFLNADVWQEVNSDSDLCIGYGCSHVKDCYFMRSRKQAAEARILIANHHLLFTDARSRMLDNVEFDKEAVLPPFSRLIIDEAHNIEHNATDFFTASYSGSELLKIFGKISRQRRVSRKGLIEELAPYSKDDKLSGSLLGQISYLAEAIGLLDTWLLAFMQQHKSSSMLIRTHMQETLVDFTHLSRQVVAYARDLCTIGTRFVEQLSVPDEFEPYLIEFNAYMHRIEAFSEPLAQFIDYSRWTDDVYWFEMVEKNSSSRSVWVHISPLSVAEKLQDHLFSKLQTVVFTSATMDLGDDFTFWGSRIGLPLHDGRAHLTGVHPSPFDFKHRLMLLTPIDAPVFSEQHPEVFINYCASVIGEAILSSQGGALVLFTSYGMLTKVTDAVTPLLNSNGITVMRQGETQRSLLLRRFIDDKNSVLFATDSFWEGVDAPGETLRLVIIAKLPFRVPTDPVFRARQEALDKNGGSGFFQLALPEATMKLKQGFGRLLRNTLDSGVVLILDSRVVNKRYGTWMLQALPESYHPETTTSGICDKIENFLFS